VCHTNYPKPALARTPCSRIKYLILRPLNGEGLRIARAAKALVSVRLEFSTITEAVSGYVFERNVCRVFLRDEPRVLRLAVSRNYVEEGVRAK
jgi:hypothetical protein